MNDHARLSPSAIRWLYCPAAPDAEAGREATRSAISTAGTEVHAHLELALRLGVDQVDWVVDPAQRHAAQMMVDLVSATWHRYPNARLYVEERLGPPAWRPQGDLFGTADAILVDDRVLLIADLKYGLHGVEAASEQLQIYLALAVERFGLRPRMMTVVVQPRLARMLRVALWTAADVAEFTTRLQAAAAATDRPGAERHTNPHCWFCRARPDCPAIAADSADRAQSELDAVLTPPQPGAPAQRLPTVRGSAAPCP